MFMERIHNLMGNVQNVKTCSSFDVFQMSSCHWKRLHSCPHSHKQEYIVRMINSSCTRAAVSVFQMIHIEFAAGKRITL